MNFSKLSLLLCVSLLSSACTWVKTTDRGAHVKVLTEADISHCRKAGTTTVSVMDKVMGVPRSYHTMSTELANLARNEASNLGGDTVVPVGDIINGQQEFGVYDCRVEAGGAMTIPYTP